MIHERVKKYEFTFAVIFSAICIIFAINIKLPLSQFSQMSWDNYCKIQIVPCSIKSGEYLEKNKIKNVFSYYDWGGWIIWNYPEAKPSIDGRMHIWRDEKGYSATEEHLDYFNGNKNIDESSFEYAYIPNLRAPIFFQISELISQNKWKIVFEDDESFIVQRVKKQ